MSAITSKPPSVPSGRRFTPDDLLALPDAVNYELVDGRLVERGMGTTSSWIGGELHGRLREYCGQQRLGWTFPADASYQCFPDEPARVRKPDVSFIRFGRLPGEQLPEGHTRIAPDFAVEVVSPNDLALELDRKVKEYLAAGVRLVWVIFPDTRSARIHRANGSVAEVRENDELGGEDVIPGFRCTVRDLLPPASLPAETKT